MERQTDKSTRWQFTAQSGQFPYFINQPPNDLIAEWGFQEEIAPDKGTHHLQGYLRTKRQVRLSQLRTIYPGVHFEIAKNWNALKNYSKKEETAVPGTQVMWVSEEKALTMKDTLVLVASNITEGIVGRCSRIFQEDMTGKVKPPTKQEIKQEIIEEYWDAVNKILSDQPNLIGLLSQPQYQRAWENTRAVWIQERDRQTDRQTDLS